MKVAVPIRREEIGLSRRPSEADNTSFKSGNLKGDRVVSRSLLRVTSSGRNESTRKTQRKKIFTSNAER